MRFLVLMFLLVTLVSCILAVPHHTSGHTDSTDHADGEHNHTHDHGTGEHTHAHDHGTGKHTSSSEESSESDEVACTGAHEVKGCAKKEAVCGGAQEVPCSMKCICAQGYSRKGAVCVPSDQCGDNRVRRTPSDCEDKNEVYLYCGSACPARCGDKPGSRVCTTECVRGCYCKKGFVLNTHNKCVAPGKC